LSVALNSSALSQMKSIKIIRLLRLLKLIRILKSSRIFLRLEVSCSVPYQRFALTKFLVILLLVCHWESCVWAMSLSMTSETQSRWIDSLVDMESNLASSEKTLNSPLKMYIASFYFCSYTMTSVGYGDIGPKNLLERVICIAIILLSGLCWAYILGEVCGIVGDMNADAQSFRKKMDNLNHMMSERDLPQSMRRRLRTFFLASKDSVKHGTQKELLRGMSPALQGEVSMALNVVWMGKVQWMKQFLEEAQDVIEGADTVAADGHRKCVADLARNLDTMSFAQGEIFGEIQILHILYKGLVAMGGKVMKTGSVWGEDFVLADKNLIKSPRACALTYAEIIYMNRKSLVQVIDAHIMNCPLLAWRVRRIIVRMAMQRGIMAEAERRKSEGVKLRCLGNRQPTLEQYNQPNRFEELPEMRELPNQIW